MLIVQFHIDERRKYQSGQILLYSFRPRIMGQPLSGILMVSITQRKVRCLETLTPTSKSVPWEELLLLPLTTH